ncbi:glycoside hydrolase family 3 protein [Niveispirillum sp. KHB5.9]|uniref:glycoside hydrolase family 3 protein n=1 Tax=Niveispirillum sp. KHB5.9 TaxID=3400269 RepID=UPI003A8C70E7
MKLRSILLSGITMGLAVSFSLASLPPGSDGEAGIADPARWPAVTAPKLGDAATEAKISAMLARMSVEEKVGQMIQADLPSIKPADLRAYPLGSVLAGGDSAPFNAPDRAGVAAWVETARALRAVALEQRSGHEPIPLIFGIDAVHGNSNVVGATLFPHNIGLGAANDPDLIRRIGAATALETAAAGIDWAFAPTLAVPRDARWGRTYEGYSENPEIVRRYAGAMVTGLQGAFFQAGHDSAVQPSSVQAGHVAASAKHFLGDGATTGGIDQGDAAVSEDELIRVHAAGYPPAIEAGAMTVMVSFSSWQGVKMHGNGTLLQGVLKDRWGFDGFVVSDWNGHEQVPGCTDDDCPASVLAGIDMLMAPYDWKKLFKKMVAQVKDGTIPMARLDDAVRRILRVKFRLGLFEAGRPLEGRGDLLGSAPHRALAREAAAKSLVLLKNQGKVLPLKGGARVLVAGSGADDIGRQSGGWSLSWQGTGNRNSDFPNAQSIYGGLKEALGAQGGQAILSVDGTAGDTVDVAILVFGEAPYAEGQGDIPTLEYQPGDKEDLALLKRLKARGIPVVSVFLSGRPLWVNPEINASDAFVAAWLPGSEGGAVADVLIGDREGKPRQDFQGRLPFAWPNSAVHGAEPLFRLGYGLDYAELTPVMTALSSLLSEQSGVSPAAANTDTYFVRGRTPAPWRFSLRQGGTLVPVGNDGSIVKAGEALSLRPIDAGGLQGAGRALVWTGKGDAALTVTGGPVLDLARLSLGNSLLLDYRVDQAPQGIVRVGVGQGGELDLTPVLTAAPLGQWRSVKIRLSCFKQAGADLAKAATPFTLAAGAPAGLSLATVRIVSDVSDAICPAAIPNAAR